MCNMQTSYQGTYCPGRRVKVNTTHLQNKEKNILIILNDIANTEQEEQLQKINQTTSTKQLIKKGKIKNLIKKHSKRL